MELSAYPPGIPCWIELKALDPVRAAGFYSLLFGWRIDEPEDQEERRTALMHEATEWRVAYLRGKPVAAVTPKYLPGRPGWLTYVSVESADATAASVKQVGGQVISEPSDIADAGRAAVFTDPAGAVFGVWQPGRHAGAALVNEPGAARRNVLETREPELVVPFYRAVFGWEPMAGGAALGPVSGWYLHGQAVAGLRALHDSAPAGETSRWMVYFGAADVNDAADRVRRLGGAVYAEPADVSAGRMAVLGDSQGVAFGVLEDR